MKNHIKRVILLLLIGFWALIMYNNTIPVYADLQPIAQVVNIKTPPPIITSVFLGIPQPPLIPDSILIQGDRVVRAVNPEAERRQALARYTLIIIISVIVIVLIGVYLIVKNTKK